jgi:nuclear receptor subfamily 2 group A
MWLSSSHSRIQTRYFVLQLQLYSFVDQYFNVETPGLSDSRPVELLHDQAQCILADYVRQRYPRQLTRFGRLLLLLPCLRLVRSSTVELLFFKETLGDVAIGRVLADIYTTDKQSHT